MAYLLNIVNGPKIILKINEGSSGLFEGIMNKAVSPFSGVFFHHSENNTGVFGREDPSR